MRVINNRVFLISAAAIASVVLNCLMMAELTSAITESEDNLTLRDANASTERPRLDSYDLTDQEREHVETAKESFSFNADVSRLMDIIINSLYTKKEVFIRELISNASDALDKVRFLSVTDPDFLGNTPKMEIRIDFDTKEKTLSITDTGIGMTKAELVKNLGTVAKSGTTAFLEAMGSGGKGDNMSLIGQFGVGFYSAYLVANKVVVTSKSNDDEQHIWTSTADSKFFVTKDPRGDTLGRGTRVTLHLKDDAVEFVEQERIKNLVKKYSEFINYPISIYVSREVREQVPVDTPEPENEDAVKLVKSEDEEESEPQTEQKKDESDIEVTDEGEAEADPTTADEEKEEEQKTKTVTKTVWEWEHVNEIKAIWLRDRNEITEEEYNGFYKTISKDAENPLAYTHFAAEGEIEFKSILYVPSSAPVDLYDGYHEKSTALKLYVRRVLIAEEFEDLMPKYFNFVKGVVDSDDLPLNVSREQLQQMKMLKVMSKKLVRKTIEMLRGLADEELEDDEDEIEEVEEVEETQEDKDTEKSESEEEDEDDEEDEEEETTKYETFWKGFGKNIKLGVIEDSTNRQKLAKLLRFYTTNDPDELVSLDEYLSRMKESQKTILYLAGDSKDQVLNSPILKKYQQKGFEVLLLSDPIDEFCVQHLQEFERRNLKSIAKDDLSVMDEDDEVAKKKHQKLKQMYKPLTDWYKTKLGKRVERVSISNKLVDAPLFVFTSQYGYSAQMEKINKAQAFSRSEDVPDYMLAKKTLELNPYHPVMKTLLEQLKESDNGKLNDAPSEYAELLFNMALINSGFNIDEPTKLTDPLEKLIKVGFGLAREEPNVEIDIEIDEEDEDEIDYSDEAPQGVTEDDEPGELDEVDVDSFAEDTQETQEAQLITDDL